MKKCVPEWWKGERSPIIVKDRVIELKFYFTGNENPKFFKRECEVENVICKWEFENDVHEVGEIKRCGV